MTGRRTPHVLVDGLATVESPRWHEGRLWCAHWGADEILAVDLDGTCQVAAPGRSGFGWSLDWLPDGRMLVTGETLLRREEDGTLIRHADLTGVTGLAAGLPPGVSNELVVAANGNAYVNSIEFDFASGGEPAGGVIALVTAEGQVRRVADELAFPNGMALTPDQRTLLVAESFGGRITAFTVDDDGALHDRRVWAEVDGAPDGICLDAEGAVWYADVPNQHCVRVAEGGEVLDRVPTDRGCFACVLGGPDRRTLLLMLAEFDPTGTAPERRTGQIAAVDVDVPGAGRP